MSQRFIKGRTNNHLTWVMVDATDFATPESALSAATKIKIYGKLTGGTGTNFVSSGTGSLTNDITHVGASALGIYTIALVKADLSDASAAWYDQYVVSLSATGAAYQTLVVDGGILESYLSQIGSDIYSMAVANSDAVSNVMSAVLLTQSLASDAASAAAQANSRVLLTQSLASDAASAAIQANSRVLLGNSMISDVDSALTSQFALLSDAISDVKSAVLLTQSLASDAHSAAAQANSRVILGNSMISDVDSALTSQFNAMSDAVSNVYSALTSTRAEPGQGAPAATAAPLAKLDYLYKAWRNKTDQTATKYKLYADDTTTVDQSAAVSDDATTYTKAEVGTGA